MNISRIPIIALFFSVTVLADGVTAIQFPTGQSSRTVSASVVRGERDRYSIIAKQGQTMTVAIYAIEDNAVFNLYAPKYRLQADGSIAGETLPNAGEGDDAVAWTGVLPSSGRYLIAVGGTRGNASYQLTVTIR
ncbi:hypothetical protein CKO12_12580 [Chromatium okenii]|uniref:hypothetical protein n=2 Tax=Pseudomonadota TaxID=1224 RepID=UPI0019055176|nr:hypothetical protein [Chromatium okenii]MBK1642690.1 hypothetical protein [Chromatium okenii]